MVEQANPNLEAPPTSEDAPDQSDDGGQPKEVNWEERAKTAEATVAGHESAITKLTSNVSTLEGRVRKQTDSDTLVAGFTDRLQGVEASVTAVARAMANDDLGTLGDEVTAIEQRTQAKTAATSRRTLAASLGQGLQDALQGSDGKPVFDLVNAPELESVRETWNLGLKQLDSSDTTERAEGRATLVQAISDAKTTALVAERTTTTDRITKMEADHKADRAKWAEENGVEDLSTGTPSSSAASLNGAKLEEGLGNGSIPMTPENQKKLEAFYRSEGFKR